MSFGIIPSGVHEGRVYLECESCGKHHTIHAYGVHKTRAHAEAHGWTVRARQTGADLCPSCKETS